MLLNTIKAAVVHASGLPLVLGPGGPFIPEGRFVLRFAAGA
jgi:hypothetical protein